MDLDIIYNEDCLETLKRLPDQSVNCCVTSPPYYGLRDYGTATWVGGDPNCDHKAAKLKSRYDYSLDTSLIQDGNRKGTDAPKYMNICPDCGGTLKDGACGGLSINKWCLICGHGFNDMFLFGSERIPAIYI